MSTKGLQVPLTSSETWKMSQPLLCTAACGGLSQSWCEIETVAAFCVLIRLVHDVGAVFFLFFCQLVISVSELKSCLPVCSAVGSALRVVAMAAMQGYDERVDC